MAWQLIFTSAARTLTAGQSGYGTVARSVEMREALIQKLEQLSYYSHPPAPDASQLPPVISAYRIINLRGTKYHLLTRIVDAGLDFTQRTNHLAHHLVFTPDELAWLPSPADIFQRWVGWRTHWSEGPRFLDESDWANLDRLPRVTPLPATTWQRITGDARRAAALVTQRNAAGCFLICDAVSEPELLSLFAESLQLLAAESQSPAKRWEYPFTTLLQDQDNPADFRWRGCKPGFAHGPAAQRNTAALTTALSDLAVPEGALADLARRGAIPAVTPDPAPLAQRVEPDETRSPLRLQKPPARDPVPLQGWSDEEFAKPRSRAEADPDVITIGPRLYGPLLGILALLVLLVGGLVWPGWFTKFSKEPKASRTSSTNEVKPEPNLNPDPGVLAEAAPASPREATPNATPLPPPDLTTLDAQMDRIPTYLFLRNPESVQAAEVLYELGGVPELESLLTQVMDNVAPVLPTAIEWLVSADRILLIATNTFQPIRPSFDGFKRLSAATPKGDRLQIDFGDWYLARQKPPLLRVIGSGLARRNLSVVFRPVSNEAPFSAFRVVALGDKTSPPPLQLSKSFLRANQTTFKDSLNSVLWDSLKLLRLPPSTEWQLRPFTGPKIRDLYEEILRTKPAVENELNFELVREQLGQQIAAAKSDVAKLTTEVRKLEASREEVSAAATFALGQKLGYPTNDALASFHSHLRSRKAIPTRGAFRLYLLGVLREKLPSNEDAIKRLEQPDCLETLRKLPKLLADLGHKQALEGIPHDYFADLWEKLGRLDKLPDRQRAKTKAEAELAGLEAVLTQVPPDLAATPQVSLFVVDQKGARLFELIRFADPPQP